MKEQMIALEKIRFKENRTHGGEGDIQLLAESIKMNGLINAITVKPEVNGFNEGVAGRRRKRAAAILGWEKIRCNVLEGDEVARADEIDVAENVNRLGMHPLDEAAVFKNLMENGETAEALAKRFDRKVSEIMQRLQLLDLNEDIKAMFKDGYITLLSAAMLKNLSEEGQKEFYRMFKKHQGVIENTYVKSFISNLDHDRLYGFLRDKQCAECKTRTFFSDKNLFPELDDVSENCFNHNCYLQKWDKTLANRIKSLKGNHKTHAETRIIASNDNRFQKIAGNKITIDGIEYKALPYRWDNRAEAKDKGARPCFLIGI